MSVSDFAMKAASGEMIDFSAYQGKVLLIVNTATGCGFTPQYEGLEALYGKYHDQGLEILDFPCNQFGHQAPGTDEEIVSFCQLNYHTSFQQFAKIDVNGEDESPAVYWAAPSSGILQNSLWIATAWWSDGMCLRLNRQPSKKRLSNCYKRCCILNADDV